MIIPELKRIQFSCNLSRIAGLCLELRDHLMVVASSATRRKGGDKICIILTFYLA